MEEPAAGRRRKKADPLSRSRPAVGAELTSGSCLGLRGQCWKRIRGAAGGMGRRRWMGYIAGVGDLGLPLR